MKAERLGSILSLASLAVTAGCLSGNQGNPHADGVSFELSFGGVSPVVVSDFSNATADMVAVSVRSYLERPDHGHFRLSGSGHAGWLDRYEVSWPVYVTPSGNREQLNNRYPQATVTNSPLGPVEFEYELRNAGAAAAILMEHGTFHGQDSLEIETVIKNPFVANGGGSVAGGKGHADERQWWELEGPHLLGRPESLAGSGKGASRIYWTNSTLILRNSSGARPLESRVWDDPVVTGPAVVLRHAVWHELRLVDTRVNVTLGRPGSDTKLTLLAHKIDFGETKTLTISANTAINGTLPATAEANGSSLWVMGDMSLLIEAQREASDIQPVGEVYRAHAHGTALAVGVGGRPAVQFSAEVAVGVVGILALLGALAYALRGFLFSVLGYSKVQRGRASDHPVRHEVFLTIQQTPGINFVELRRRVRRTHTDLPISVGGLEHHLGLLERWGLIGSRKMGRFRRYYVADEAKARKRMDAWALERPAARAIAAALQSQPGIHEADLHRAVTRVIEITWPGMRYHLVRMKRQGFIEERVAGRRRSFAPTQLLEETLKHAATS